MRLSGSRVKVAATATAAAITLPFLGSASASATQPKEPVNTNAPATQAQRNSRPPDDPRTVNGSASTASSGFTTASAFDDCPVGFACAWVDINWGGPRGQWAGNNADWGAFSQGACQQGNWKNCASSARNNGTQCSVSFYRTINYGPGATLFFLGSSSSNLGNQLANDDYESNAWC